MNPPQPVLHRLMEVIERRKSDHPANSYTALLLDSGTQRISSKIREEVEELIEAANDMTCSSPKFIIHEAADLFYHTLVLLAACDVTISEVEQELDRRFGTSGLTEKASRRKSCESPPRKG